MPKILFIQPTQYAISEDGTRQQLCKQKIIHLPSLVFPLLAAMTPSDWEVEVNLEVVDDVDYDNDADLIGIGSMGHAIFRGVEIAAEFLKRGKTVVMGGYMASLAATEAAKHVDSVIIGDAEKAYPRMLRDFMSGQPLAPFYEEPVTELRDLPLPRYELLTSKPISNLLPVQAGRGCSHNCSFCAIACLYKGRYLFRPVDEVIRDIARIKELGYKRFYLIDDNIISNPRYLEDLCREMEGFKMKWATQCDINLARNRRLLDRVVRAGGYMFSFGIESITQEGLNNLNKGWMKVADHAALIRELSAAGILVSSEMILGTDSDTIESIRATRDFVDNTRIPLPRFYILTPTPGTQLFEQYKAEDRLLTTDLYQYTGTECVHRPARISPEELTREYWRLARQVFTLRSILRRTLLHPHFFRQPLDYIFAFFVNLHYRHYIRRGIPPNIF